jgi:hypothetical protein
VWIPRYKARLQAVLEGPIALSLLLASLAATPSPSPSPLDLDPNLVTPGPEGFLIVFGIALVAILLILARYRGELQERLEAEKKDESPTDS